jgi:hypothetical protein
MDLLDGLDDDGDGDVDNPIEIEARTASVLKPVEPDQSEQAQTAVAEEVTEGAKRKVRMERKSRSLKIYFLNRRISNIFPSLIKKYNKKKYK